MSFDPFRDLTEAERKEWLNVKHDRNAEAGRATPEKAREMVREQTSADRDRAADDGGRERERTR